MKRIQRNWIYLLPAVFVVLADQVLKLWVRTNMTVHGTYDAWPGVFELYYVKNTGAAFSLLGTHTWLLAVISALASLVLMGLILSGYFKKRMAQLALALVLGGAVGNLIDRVMLGFVVDMFSLEFIDFAIFNIADIGVTLGGVGFCAYIIFFWQRESKEAATHSAAPQPQTSDPFDEEIAAMTESAENKKEREE